MLERARSALSYRLRDVKETVSNKNNELSLKFSPDKHTFTHGPVSTAKALYFHPEAVSERVGLVVFRDVNADLLAQRRTPQHSDIALSLGVALTKEVTENFGIQVDYYLPRENTQVWGLRLVNLDICESYYMRPNLYKETCSGYSLHIPQLHDNPNPDELVVTGAGVNFDLLVAKLNTKLNSEFSRHGVHGLMYDRSNPQGTLWGIRINGFGTKMPLELVPMFMRTLAHQVAPQYTVLTLGEVFHDSAMEISPLPKNNLVESVA